MQHHQRQSEWAADDGLLQQIREGCLQRGWDEGELARRAGVSRTTLYYLRRGTTQRPRASTLFRIAQALGLDPGQLDREQPGRGEPGPQRPEDLAGSGDSQRRQRFDRRTNPLVEVVRCQQPELFAGWSEAEWDELHSTFGTGGALHEEGVVREAARMNRRRETVQRLQVVLETHLADVAERMVETLFEMTRPGGNGTSSNRARGPESIPDGGSVAKAIRS